MRKTASILLMVVAGILLYTICVLAFIDTLPAGLKVGIVAGFSLHAIAAHCGGLALTRFRRWRRDTEVVLLSASGFTAFASLNMAYLLSA